MKRSEVEIGERYLAKVSGKRQVVKITRAHAQGGWTAVNVATGREVRIKTAARLWGKA